MRKLWITNVQAQASGMPCLIPRQVEVNGEWVWEGKWAGAPEPVADILLTYTRCAQLGCPVKPKERPSAYIYNSGEGSKYRYVPLWARFAEQIDISKANELELRVLRRRRGDGVR
ncbi:hypothetical protein GNP94_22075 [Paenibacillus campinasensis]|uniref:Uncharacterized protein n=1 Tax=Paenibacillus campinasensis TaxID=66347 RepID=A0ABW9T6Y9_9BACL|nr:hypothetical protein [Paenibacillus campinasensis]MUG68662.1 hypothetical protein [Paenibacillus campinasensis]